MALLDYSFGAAVFGASAPTLLVWGDRDEWAPVRIAHLLEDRIPGSQLSFLKDSGHVPMKDQPAALAELVTRYLDEPNKQVPEADPPNEQPPDRRCEKQDDQIITGDYREIILDHCKHAWLNRVRARRIEHGYVTDGVIADSSDLVITGGESEAR